MSDPASSDALDPLPSPDRYAVLRVRDFRLYLIGRLVASFGQQMLGVAVSWELFERTNSTLALGFVGLVQIVPLFLLTLPAGQLADRRDRRKVVVAMEILTALACAGLTYVSWRQVPVGWIYGFLFLSAVARSFLWPASSALLPQIVSRAHLAAATTWNSGGYQISAALGPVVGGFVIYLTGRALDVYAFNVIAGLICAGLLWQIRGGSTEIVTRPRGGNLSDMIAGLRFVFRHRIILATITLDLFAVLLGGATALLPVYSRDILHVGPVGLGWLRAALPLGSATMALVVVHRPPMQRAGRALLWAVAGFGLATMVFGWSRSFWLSLAMLFACGAMDNISVVVRHTLVQILTPDELRGRVSAVNTLFIGGSNEFGEFESGLAAHWFGPTLAVIGGGVGTILVVCATALIWPEMRRIGRLDAQEPTSEPP